MDGGTFGRSPRVSRIFRILSQWHIFSSYAVQRLDDECRRGPVFPSLPLFLLLIEKARTCIRAFIFDIIILSRLNGSCGPSFIQQPIIFCNGHNELPMISSSSTIRAVNFLCCALKSMAAFPKHQLNNAHSVFPAPCYGKS